VVQDDGRRLHPQCQAINRKAARLLDKLPDPDNRAQNAHRINRSFQQVPALFFRANQERVSSLTVHRWLILSSKDAARFRFCLMRLRIEDSCLGIQYWMRRRNGLDSINAQLPGSFPPDARYLIGVSGGRDSVVLLRRPFDLGYRKLIVCHFNHRLRRRETFIHWQARLRSIPPAFCSRAGTATPTRQVVMLLIAIRRRVGPAPSRPAFLAFKSSEGPLWRGPSCSRSLSTSSSRDGYLP
jgi:hypothetical protein